MNFAEIIAVAVGGAIGCVGRYAMEHIGLFTEKMWHTVLINLIGCLVIGIATAIISKMAAPNIYNRLIVTGMLGGFTTFSAFSLHPIQMMRQGMIAQAIAYVAITVIGGLLLCWLGLMGTEKILHS